MLIPSLYTSASTAPFPRSVRDGNSILFGTPVKQFISKTRASWTAGQTAFFREWIKMKGQANFRTCDLNPLFKRLEIDGYRGITNALGEDIEQLLIKKVKAKLTAENKRKKEGKMGGVGGNTSNATSGIQTPVNEEVEEEVEEEEDEELVEATPYSSATNAPATNKTGRPGKANKNKTKRSMLLKRTIECLVKLKEATRDVKQAVAALPEAGSLDDASDDIACEVAHLETLLWEYVEY